MVADKTPASVGLLTTDTPPPKRRQAARRTLWAGLGFVSPWIVGLILFTLLPMALSLYYSVTNYSLIGPARFVGLHNYRFLATDPEFRQAMVNTLFLVVLIVPLNVLVALFYGMLMDWSMRGQRLFRTLLYLPTIVPAVAQGLLWSWMFNTNFGLINQSLQLTGLQGPDWLSNLAWGRMALVIIWLWGAGQSSILVFSALRGVRRDLYEQAQVDGGSVWWRIWHVTLPQISPVMFFNVVMTLIGVMQYFTQAWILFGNNLPLLIGYIYTYAFQDLAMGIASAASWVLLAVTSVLVVLLFVSRRWWVFYND